MTWNNVILAQLDGLNPLNPTAPITKGTGMVFNDIVLIVGAGLAVGLILLLFVRVYVRRSRRKHHGREHRSNSVPVAPVENHAEKPRHGHSRRRRHRRDHRQRNPTLSETGGLPASKSGTTSNPPV